MCDNESFQEKDYEDAVEKATPDPVDVKAAIKMLQEQGSDWEEPVEVDLDDLPLEPMFWTVVVQPLEPRKQSAGGIVFAEDTVRAQEFQAIVGRLLAKGPLAFSGTSPSGLNLAVEKVEPGDWVGWPRYCGQEYKLKNGGRVIVMNDSDLIVKVKRPRDFVIYV